MRCNFARSDTVTGQLTGTAVLFIFKPLASLQSIGKNIFDCDFPVSRFLSLIKKNSIASI